MIRSLSLALGVVLLIAVGTVPAVTAAPSPKRRVAVLEFRSGSAELKHIDERAAEVLKNLTSLQVVDSRSARQQYGARLDRDVVRCAGDPVCIANVGKKLEVHEVLLVGVSEFGDVILTLQRINAESGEVENRVAEALAPGNDPSAEMMRRYLRRVMPESDFMRFGILHIDAPLRGAQVTINKKNRGKTPLDPLRLQAPANYDILVSKSGYTPFRASVQVPPDAKIRVKANLSARQPGAWYKTWWAASLAATLVVGSTTLIILTTRPELSDVPVQLDPF